MSTLSKAVNQKQTAYNNAEDALKGTNAAQLEKNLSEATIKAQQNQKKVEQAKASKTQAEANKQHASAALDAAEKAQKQAAADVSARQSAADKTQTALNEANSALEAAKVKAERLNDQLQSVNTITLPAGYFQALKNYEDYQEQSDWNQTEANRLSKAIKDYKAEAQKLNQYKSNSAEKKVIVNTNSMTAEQQKELTLYVANLINQIRSQAGTSKIIVTPGSVALGNKIVKEGYNDANWDAFGPHMIDGKGHNNKYLDKVGDGENIAGNLVTYHISNGEYVRDPYNSIQSMDALKKSIYSDFIDMMFLDAHSDWGHSLNLINYGAFNVPNSTLGFGFDKYGYSHYEFTSATDQNHLGDNPYTIPSNTELIAELNNAKQDRSAKQTTADNAKSANDTAQQALKDAQTDQQADDEAVANAQTSLEKAQAALDDATIQLKTAEKTLRQSKAVQASAQQAVANMSADLKAKQKVVDQAEQALNAAKSALNTAQSNLSSKQGKVRTAKVSLGQAKRAVTDAQKAIDNANATAQKVKDALIQAKKVTLNAQSVLQTAKDQLAIDQKTQQIAQKAVDNFNADQVTKQAAVKQAQQALDKANDELTSAQQALAQAKQDLISLQKVADNKAQAVKNAQATVKKGQAKLADLNNQLVALQNAPQQLAAAQQKADQASQELIDAKDALQREQLALQPFTEAIQRAQDKLIAAQKKADQTAQAVKDAKRDLDKANTKLADAKTTDAQRYGKQVVVNPIDINAGDPVPDPKLANALTLPVSKNNDGTLSLVVNNGQAAELPAGTTAAWANKAQVTTDAQHAGNYAEDVLVTFPDGSQTTVKAQMNVAANEAGQGVSVSQNGTISSSSGHRTAENSTSNVGSETSLMTREAYKVTQQAKQSQLPQTGNDQSSILAMLGLTLLTTTMMAMFGVKKRA